MRHLALRFWGGDDPSMVVDVEEAGCPPLSNEASDLLFPRLEELCGDMARMLLLPLLEMLRLLDCFLDTGLFVVITGGFLGLVVDTVVLAFGFDTDLALGSTLGLVICLGLSLALDVVGFLAATTTLIAESLSPSDPNSDSDSVSEGGA